MGEPQRLQVTVPFILESGEKGKLRFKYASEMIVSNIIIFHGFECF